jgi:hypothetical protein
MLVPHARERPQPAHFHETYHPSKQGLSACPLPFAAQNHKAATNEQN